MSDGYLNSRGVKYSSKGKGDGEFDLVHDGTLDGGGLVYVSDRTNARIYVVEIRKWRVQLPVAL